MSAPHHPATNGLAERAVGVVKEGVKRMQGHDLENKLPRFLFDYRITPHSTTGTVDEETGEDTSSPHQAICR